MRLVEQGAVGGQPGSAAAGSQSWTSLLLGLQAASHAETLTPLLSRWMQQSWPAQSAVDVHWSSERRAPEAGAEQVVWQAYATLVELEETQQISVGWQAAVPQAIATAPWPAESVAASGTPTNVSAVHAAAQSASEAAVSFPRRRTWRNPSASPSR